MSAMKRRNMIQPVLSFLAEIVDGGQPIDPHAESERRVSEIRIQISDRLYRGRRSARREALTVRGLRGVTLTPL
jgi:hypothetical protein